MCLSGKFVTMYMLMNRLLAVFYISNTKHEKTFSFGSARERELFFCFLGTLLVAILLDVISCFTYC